MAYYDQNEWRQHTREVERRLIERIASRPPPDESEHRYASRERRLESSTLPPVFEHPDPQSYDPRTGEFHEVRVANRSASVDSRSARFRDTHLYGPPPPRPIRRYDSLGTADGARLAPPPNAILLDQKALNAGIRREAAPPPTDEYGQPRALAGLRTSDNEPIYPDLSPQTQTVMTPLGPLAVRSASGLSPRAIERAERRARLISQGASRPTMQPTPLTPPDLGPQPSYPPPQPILAPTTQLTPAQKKRLRKKRAKQNQQAPPTNGVYPTPNLSKQETRYECGHETLAHLRNGYVFRLVCTQHPWPHTGQPHMMKLQSEDGCEIFCGWWREGE